MPKRLRKKREYDDGTQSAFRALQHVIDVTEGPPQKDPAAVALGRKGGLKSAAGRMKLIPKVKRRQIAKRAAAARWRKKR